MTCLPEIAEVVDCPNAQMRRAWTIPSRGVVPASGRRHKSIASLDDADRELSGRLARERRDERRLSCRRSRTERCYTSISVLPESGPATIWST
jgi:hypothetical protein